MGMVSIHIPSMADLVAGMESARSGITDDSGAIKRELTAVGVTTASQAGAERALRFIDAEIVGVRRRLAMARHIEAQTPGKQPYAQFDEAIISDATPAEARARGKRAAALVAGLTDLDGANVPQELLDLLAENLADPYFAAAFARNVEPADLSHGLLDLTSTIQRKRGSLSSFDREGIDDFEESYAELIEGLGATMGLATRNGGDLALDAGTAKSWVDFITSEDQVGEDNVVWFGQGAALTALTAYGSWDADFLTEVSQGVYFYERSTFGEREGWRERAGGDGFHETQYVWLPDRGSDPDQGMFSYDPLTNLMYGLGGSREAAQAFLGGTVFDSDAELTVDGTTKRVPDTVHYLITQRRWPADDAFGAQLAMATAVSPYPGEEAADRETREWLAAGIKHTALFKQAEIEARAEDGGNWFSEVGHLVLDGLGLVPVVGEPADAVNGVWYAAEGDVVNAGLSFAALVPLGGQLATAGKWTLKGADGAVLARSVDALSGFTRLDGTALEVSEAGFALTARSRYVEPGVFEFSSRRAFNAATKHPHPGVTYRYKGMDWTTDEAGRTISVTGAPRLASGGRNTRLQGRIGKEGRDSDVGFHLLADSLGGPTNRLNVVPGNGKPIDDDLANLNQGEYASMERYVRDSLRAGDDVEISILPRYVDDSPRPAELKVDVWVSGELESFKFINK